MKNGRGYPRDGHGIQHEGPVLTQVSAVSKTICHNKLHHNITPFLCATCEVELDTLLNVNCIEWTEEGKLYWLVGGGCSQCCKLHMLCME